MITREKLFQIIASLPSHTKDIIDKFDELDEAMQDHHIYDVDHDFSWINQRLSKIILTEEEKSIVIKANDEIDNIEHFDDFWHEDRFINPTIPQRINFVVEKYKLYDRVIELAVESGYVGQRSKVLETINKEIDELSLYMNELLILAKDDCQEKVKLLEETIKKEYK